MNTQVQTTETVERNALPKRNTTFSKRALLGMFIAITAFKVLLMLVFSSGYQTELFQPFVQHFLTAFDNSWDYFLANSTQRDQFPYQPLMLYIVAFSCLPLKFIGWQNVLAVNFFMKLPTLVSDIGIAVLLAKMFPARVKKVLWYYYLSPIIIYACYMHSQLDLIPTAMLFATVYFLRKDSIVKAAMIGGFSLATKAHVAAAFPLFFLYIWRNRRASAGLGFLFGALCTALFIIFPYVHSPGFQQLVLLNPRQSHIFDAHYDIGDMKICLPILAVMIVYGRLALYPKINSDLLDSFLTIVFSLFVLLIVPAPGWYVWIAPFLSLFLIKYGDRDKRLIVSCYSLYVSYLLYFLLFHKFDHTDLFFLSFANPFKIESHTLRSIAFTMLEASLFINIVICYRTGVKSNAIYKRDKAIVIGIGGDSGAGKSTLLQDVKHLLHGRVLELEGDADHKWKRDDEHWRSLTHLDPKANFLHRQAETLLNLKRGRSVARVNYDHETGNFTDARVVQPNDFIVLSGLHTFYLAKSRKIIDLKIFLDPERAVKRHWKLMRDVKERNYTEQQVHAQMNRRSTDVDKFIAPQQEFADLAISYFAKTQFDEKDIDVKPELSLKVSLSSSVELEDLVQELIRNDLPLNWDYKEDLSKQDLVLPEPVPIEILQRFAAERIPNLDELVDCEIEWQEGFRGFIQLIILIALSDLMKEKEEVHEV